LKPNMRLVLIRSLRPGLSIDDDRAKHATFLGEDGVQWDFDKETYSLSGLCRRICEEYAGQVRSGAFACPDFWALDGEKVPLSQMAKELQRANVGAAIDAPSAS
jgi:hypothetical protein